MANSTMRSSVSSDFLHLMSQKLFLLHEKRRTLHPMNYGSSESERIVASESERLTEKSLTAASDQED